MPEYLAPGVYVEEMSYRSKSIEGVSTTTTGFVGPTRYGPIDSSPIYYQRRRVRAHLRRRQPPAFADDGDPIPNFVWHGVRAFFEEGGKRLYVVRVFRPSGTSDGRALAYLPATGTLPATIRARSRFAPRFPGAAGKMRVRFTVGSARTSWGSSDGADDARRLQPGDIVWITERDAPASGRPYRVEEFFDEHASRKALRFSDLARPSPQRLTPTRSPPDLIPDERTGFRS